MNVARTKPLKSVGIAVGLFLSVWIASLLVTAPVALFFGESAVQNPAVTGLLSVAATGIAISTYIFTFENGFSYLDFAPPSTQKALLGIGCGILLIAVQIILTQIFSLIGVSVSTSTAPESGTVTYYTFAALAIFAVPLVEEMFYRNIIQKHLQKTFGAATSILIAAIIFAATHSANFIGLSTATIIGTGAVVTIQGIILGYSFYRTDNITVPVLAHLINNAVAFVVVSSEFGL